MDKNEKGEHMTASVRQFDIGDDHTSSWVRPNIEQDLSSTFN
jgi:hypothetical protein